MPKQLRIKQVRSLIGRHKKRKRTMIALGLGKIGKVVVHSDTPQLRGMLRLVQDLVEVEEVDPSALGR